MSWHFLDHFLNFVALFEAQRWCNDIRVHVDYLLLRRVARLRLGVLLWFSRCAFVVVQLVWYKLFCCDFSITLIDHFNNFCFGFSKWVCSFERCFGDAEIIKIKLGHAQQEKVALDQIYLVDWRWSEYRTSLFEISDGLLPILRLVVASS